MRLQKVIYFDTGIYTEAMYKGRKRLLLAAFDFGSHQATDSGLIMAVNVHYCCKCSLRIDALDMVVADFPRRYFSLFCAPVVEGRLLNCVVACDYQRTG